MPQGYRHLTYNQRIAIKKMLDEGYSRKHMAEVLEIHLSTIYREIDRGTINGRYNPDYSEKMYQAQLMEKGPAALLDTNVELAEYIANLILNRKLSLDNVVNEIKKEKRFSDVSITKQTIYNSIIAGKVPGVTRESFRTESSTIFNDGQICIPKWVRDELGLKDGDVLDLQVTEKGEIIYKKQDR